MGKGTFLVALVLVTVAAPSALAGGHPPDPNDPRNLTWIKEGVLALGGGGLSKEDVEWLHAEGFGAIANFRAEHEDPEEFIRELGMDHLYMPVDHAVNMNATMLEAFVAWAKRMEEQGRAIYVHCTNGWHRAAVVAAAWLMAKEGLGADEAFDRVRDLRGPWAVNRAPSALLAYEARLSGETGLSVLMLSPLERPELGGEMPIVLEVLGHGRPLPGIHVRFWTEESSMRLEGTTDAEGRFKVAYRAPVGAPVDHLYARASADGFVDGADDVELFFEVPVKTARQLSIEAAPAGDRLEVRITREGRDVHARVIAWTDDGWSVTDESGTGEMSLPLPAGAERIHLRAESWGDKGASATVSIPQSRGHDGHVETTPTDRGGPEVSPQEPGTPTSPDGEASTGPVQTQPPVTSHLRLAAYGAAALGALLLVGFGAHAALQRARTTRFTK